MDRKTLNQFIKYNLDKFRQEGKCIKHSGGNDLILVVRVKTLMLDKNRTSLRTVAAKVGKIHFSTVRNIMVKDKVRAYHKRKVQKMSPLHMEKRVDFFGWAYFCQFMPILTCSHDS